MDMKSVRLKVVLTFALSSLIFSITCLTLNSVFAQTTGTERLPNRNPIQLIELKGNGYERGVEHGRQLKREISEVLTKWKTNIRNVVNGNPDSVITLFLKATNFETTSWKHTPWLIKELRGIADGSGQEYKDVFVFQLVDEFWVYLDKQFNTPNHHCSSIGVPSTENHPAYIAQNVDLENFRDGYQVLFHITASATEPQQYILSCAGMVAINGMNEKGIGICVNSLMELQASPNGLPVAFVVRGVLNKQSGPEALTFLKSVNHASGQNYILGIADSVYDFEASSNQVIRYVPNQQHNTVVYHTNHALANHDVKDWYKDYHTKVLSGETKNNNSEVRFATLEKYLDIQPNQISTTILRKVLRSKDNLKNPVCRPLLDGAYGFTFSSVLFTLGDRRSLQVTNGPPDQSEYKEYFFKK